MAENMMKVKILTLGESGVGKSALLLRYKDDKFTGNFVTTLGVEYKQKTITIDNVPLLVQVWDTAGQERFKTITPNYYRSVDGALLVFDITDVDSFEKIEDWIKDLHKANSDSDADSDLSKVTMMLAGNKVDLEEKRKVEQSAAEAKAKNYNISYIETSAKKNTNVDLMFEQIVRKVIERKGGIEKFKAQYQQSAATNNISLEKTAPQKSGSNKNTSSNGSTCC